jgi:hypothetical protein
VPDVRFGGEQKTVVVLIVAMIRAAARPAALLLPRTAAFRGRSAWAAGDGGWVPGHGLAMGRIAQGQCLVVSK